MTDVAIVGAGPYGLSLAAHLAARGVSLRVFGRPMHTWRTSMPEGMVLKSEGFASSLWDPEGSFTLRAYCEQQKLPYADMGYPIPLETFCDYGIAFQRRFVPFLDERFVTSVERLRDGFQLRLQDGDAVAARRVIVAAGIRQFDRIPDELAGLPGDLVSHSADHHKLDRFADREVLVVGGGASGVGLAGLMALKGTAVQLAVRKPRIAYVDPPRPLTLMDHVRAPVSGLGTGWRSLACCVAPMVFYRMPQDFRVMVGRKHLPAAPGWTSREPVESLVTKHLGFRVTGAREQGGRAAVTLRGLDGSERAVTADHVIAATGYQVDLRRLDFLPASVRSSIAVVQHTPILSPYFESSVPGLYFVGTVAANSFGPMLRFAYGAGFASRRITSHITRSVRRSRTSFEPTLVPART